jgi:UDP-N-acetylglucosamine 1-carboxyvinyltransferase
MSKYLISGGKPLVGEVSIRGAKNASYKQIIASLLSDKPSQLSNIPVISDVKITQSICEQIGSKITHNGEHSIEICTPKIIKEIIPHGTGQKSRTSFMFSAPLLARNKKISFPVPGGDKLGDRPLDRLFDCMKTMNVEISEDKDMVHLKTNGLKNTKYKFSKPSHTVTETIIMLSVLVPGVSIFENCAQEPEIDDLIEMLNSMGAKIKRNKRTITITGVTSLHGTKHQVIADRNEAVTFACAALATKGSINILRIDPNIIKTFLDTIKIMGANVVTGKDEISVTWTQALKSISVETGPEPLFMTDWQAVFSVVLSQAIGCSSIIEKVFPYRFHHIEEFKKMGLKSQYFNPDITDKNNYYEFNQESDKPEYFHGVKIYGPTKLKPSNFSINDLRTGASITIAALTAEGKSTIDGVEYIERGYEKLAQRLCSLGANIEYIKT